MPRRPWDCCALLLLITYGLAAQQPCALLVRGGHVIDAINDIDQVMDLAIADRRIARVEENMPESQAKRVADVSGLYVVPGLIDIHTHVYTGTAMCAAAGRDTNVQSDMTSFLHGVTTMVDAGISGLNTFPDFPENVIEKRRTRILGLLNIASTGMDSRTRAHDPDNMDPMATAKMATDNVALRSC